MSEPAPARASGEPQLRRPRGPSDEGSWLCHDEADRQRMLDMDRRLAPVRNVALGVLALAAVLDSHWLGTWTLLPLVCAAAGFPLARRMSERTSRPEYVLFGAWVFSELAIAATVAIAGVESALLAWLAIPVVTLSARFSVHGVIAGVAVALGLIVAVALGTDAAAIADFPPLLTSPAAAVIAIGILSTALMRSDFQHRGEAVIDQLTGMLNRKALARRAHELEQQSLLTGEPVAIVIGDLDHFKLVNDTLGHATGDVVLSDVAYTIRKQLRAFDLAYRLGGEEFLVLGPGADLATAVELAEQLGERLREQPFAGRQVTMSFGVSATKRGERFDYDDAFDAADAALYEAKAAGRDRVQAAG